MNQTKMNDVNLDYLELTLKVIYIFVGVTHTHTTSDLDKTRGEKITRKVQI